MAMRRERGERTLSPMMISTLKLTAPLTCLAAQPIKERTLVASCLRGALPPVLLRAVCLVRAIVDLGWGWVP